MFKKFACKSEGSGNWMIHCVKENDLFPLCLCGFAAVCLGQLEHVWKLMRRI